MKIVHTPSIAAHILDGKPYLHFPRGHPAPVALVRAISYVAICSLSGEQSLELFALNRDSLIEKCQHETDEALKIADYLVTNEVTVLQALVFFLVCNAVTPFDYH